MRLRSAPGGRDSDSFEIFRRVPSDTRGALIIPQNPHLRHAEFHKTFVGSIITLEQFRYCEIPQ